MLKVLRDELLPETLRGLTPAQHEAQWSGWVEARDAAVRQRAIVGPGLDFADKLRGYDFYPPQTIQPFAVIDSLIHHGLSDAATLRVTAFDLSPQALARRSLATPCGR